MPSLDTLLTAPLPWVWMVPGLLVVFAAGVARGFSGFGFSALCVAGLSLIVSPAQVIPAIFMLEILASITMLRSVWRDVDRSWLAWLLAGNAFCIPLGIALLAWLPETPLRLVIGGILLTIALALRAGVTVQVQPGPRGKFGTGLASGFVNGVTASGGLVVAVVMSVARLSPAALRATMVVWLLAVDVYSLGWTGLLSWLGNAPTQLITPMTLTWIVWMFPAMLAGIWVGQRSFAGVSVTRFRQVVLNLLVVVALITVVRALWSWLA